MRAAIASRLVGRAWPSPPAEPAPGEPGVLRLTPPKRGRVHLGCGAIYKRGYLNVDLPPAEGVAAGSSRPDLESDVTKVSCPADTLNEVRLHHLFEHFERAEALALLLRWYRWLRPGGRLVIETPDFEGCIANFDGRSVAEQGVILRHIFGSQEAPWAQHRDGWSANRFRYVLGELGFTGITTSQTFSDPGRLLPNVIVTARRAEGDGPPRHAQIECALGILRQSMNGQNPTEEVLFGRWREQFDRTCASAAA
jgi:SAM-dependent methyltransferase